MIKRMAFALATALFFLPARAADSPSVLVEAESFANPGGWVLDTECVHSIYFNTQPKWPCAIGAQ